MEIIILDGSRMRTVEEAHSYIARAMRFPAYYGGNLDALADCLSELGRNVNVVLMNEEALREYLGDYASRLLKVFEDASLLPDSFRWMVERCS